MNQKKEVNESDKKINIWTIKGTIIMIIISFLIAFGITYGILTIMNLDQKTDNNEIETSNTNNLDDTKNNSNNEINNNSIDNTVKVSAKKAIFDTDIETVKKEYNNNAEEISKRDNANCLKIDSFSYDTGGYSTYLSSSIKMIAMDGFDNFIFIVLDAGGESDYTIKSCEEALLKSCIPDLTKEELNDIRGQLGVSGTLKQIVSSLNSNSSKKINYKGIEILRTFILDTKSSKVAYTISIKK